MKKATLSRALAALPFLSLSVLLPILMTGTAAAANLYITNGTSSNFTSGTNSYDVTYVGDSNGVTNGNNLTVANTNTLLQSLTGLYVGYSGTSNSMVISNAGNVQGGAAVIGYETNALNNSVLVTGTNSLWSNSSTFTVGLSGGGTLTVANGGLVAATGITIAANANSAGTLNIGRFGTNDTAGTITAATIAFGAGIGTINFNQSDSTTLISSISGTGLVNQRGTGTTILIGNSSFTGLTEIVSGILQVGNGGTTGSLGSGSVSNATALVINRSGSLVMSNNVGGNGSFSNIGTGTVTLAGVNTYTGLTDLDGGKVVVSGSLTSTNDIIVGDTVSNVSLVVTNPGSVRVGNFFVGNNPTSSSNSVIVGTGTTLTVRDTVYLGFDSNNGNQFQLLNNGVAWFGTLNVGSYGSVSNTIAVTGAGSRLSIAGELLLTNAANQLIVSGGGSLTSGTGYVGSTGGSTAGGNSVSLGGVGSTWSLGTNGLIVGDNSDNNSVTVTAGAGLVSGFATIGTDFSGSPAGSNNSVLVDNFGTWTNSGNITVGNSGSGTLTIANGGSVTANALFLANSSHSVGTLNIGRLGSNDAAGTLTLTATNNSITFGSGNGSINFNQSNAIALGANISGNGSINQLGSGTSILTGNNFYTRGTLISGGVLQVGNGVTSGTLGYGAVTNTASLSFNRSDYAVVANDISGTGAVLQIGTGTTSIVGNNSYTGMTTVFAGALSVGNGGTAGNLGSSDVIINTNASLILNRSDAFALRNSLSGNGSLVVLGGSTATLLGSNFYKGPTLVDNTTLQVGTNATNGNLGRGTVILTNYATLRYNLRGTTTLTNDVSGQGYLEIEGSGTTTLIGRCTYTEFTEIGGGSALQVGEGGSSGTLGSGSVYNYGDLIFNRNNLVIVSNDISGFGTFAQIGVGTLVLTGDNGYSGGTRITNGALQVGNGGTNGTLGSGNVSNNASLVFNRSNYAVFANTIGGSGSTTQIGSGTTVFTGNNSYSGVTTISSGVLQVGNNGATGTLGSGNVVINTNASLSIYRDGAYDLLNAISGGGSLDIRGSGTKTLLGNNTYRGATFIDNATLQVGKNGTNSTIGSGAVTLTNYGSLLLNLTGNSSLTNVIAGQGGLNIQGSGTTTITGDNTYTEYTTIGINATLLVGDRGTLGRLGGGTVFNRNAIIFQKLNNLLFTNSIQEEGSVTQAGSGTLSLTGSNSYAGYTAVTAGSLSLGSTGLLTGGGPINVNNGGTLLLGAANQVNTNSALNLGATGTSGTLSMGGNGSTRASTQTFNTLTLSANSSIDFANLTGQSALYFRKISGLSTYTLSIFNYNGVTSPTGTGGLDQYTSLYAKAGAGLSGFTAGELSNIKFYSGSDSSSTFLGDGSFSSITFNGFNQIVPVPEPGVLLAELLLLGWMIYSFRPQFARVAHGSYHAGAPFRSRPTKLQAIRRSNAVALSESDCLLDDPAIKKP